MKSILDHEQLPQFEFPHIDPPPLKRKVGRPSRNRRREQGEQRKGQRNVQGLNKCSICGHLGHNKKTCKGGPTRRELQLSNAREEEQEPLVISTMEGDPESQEIHPSQPSQSQPSQQKRKRKIVEEPGPIRGRTRTTSRQARK